MSDLAPLLQDAVRSGDWEPVRVRFAPDVVLRTSSERGRTRVDGADAVIAHLAGPGRGRSRTGRRASGRPAWR